MPEPCDKTTVKETVELKLKDAEEKLKRIVKSDEIITITAEENEENCKTEAENVEAPPVKTAKDISLKKRSKRPDVAVYVPRLKRLGGSASSNATPPTHLSATPPTHLSATPPTNLSAADPSISQLSASALPFTPSSSSLNANALPFCPSSPTPPELECEEAAPDPLVEEIVKEITVTVGGVQIESPDIDYLTFQTSDATINLDQFGHVIELYDFPEHFKTVDLLNGFKNFSSKWDIKWVDDTHALGVFNCAETAAEALALRHPVIKTRPLNMATKQSKVKAQTVCELLLPYKPRPATSTAPARRFLSLALGYKVPEASRQEKDRLDEARRKKEEDRRDDRRKRKEDVAGREEDNKDYDCHDYR